jgi:hypothetical protein
MSDLQTKEAKVPYQVSVENIADILSAYFLIHQMSARLEVLGHSAPQERYPSWYTFGVWNVRETLESVACYSHSQTTLVLQ